MKVKMRTTSAGPRGVLDAGKVYDLPAKQAEELVEGGYAVEIASQKLERATAAKGERADAPANKKE